jgi:hypothetical protein
VSRLRRTPARRHAFALLVLACVGTALGFVGVTALETDASSTGADERASAAARVLAGALEKRAPYVLFRDLSSPGDTHAELALAPLSSRGTSTRAGLRCERVYLSAGNGLCLAFDADPIPGYRVKLFGSDFRVRRSFGIDGFPSRARVSPDGRYGAFTIFVSGHSYRDLQFSTRTAILDMRTGRYVTRNLEAFAVQRDGERIRSRDFNFWGVTFARESTRFYATLWTRGIAYLVEGDLRNRRMRVLRENAECPSLSPDGSRLVYKKRAEGNGAWRFHVLDLTTGRETPLAEPRSRDDQVEWLDDTRVAYEGDGKIWVLPADGTGAPEILLDRAYSPTVVLRPGAS